ncbi:MAG: hypothetical protein RSA87_02955 [Malacoplasma sp.]
MKYWNYYVGIEKAFSETLQFVFPCKKNFGTFSDEYTKIIFLCCSEIDSILKTLMELSGANLKTNEQSMKFYSKFIENDEGIKKSLFGINPFNALAGDGMNFSPFLDVNSSIKYSNLEWWEDYQMLKHDRLKNCDRGNLFNAVNSLIAYYILLVRLMDFVESYDRLTFADKHSKSSFFLPCI